MRKVIIIGNYYKNDTIQQFFELGIVPVLCHTIIEALEKIRLEQISGIMFYCSRSHQDPIELILNVRDVDKKIPIYLIGCSDFRNGLEMFKKHPGIYGLLQANPDTFKTMLQHDLEKESSS